MAEKIGQQNAILRRQYMSHRRQIIALSKALECTLSSLKHIREHHPSKYEKGEDEIFGEEMLIKHGIPE